MKKILIAVLSVITVLTITSCNKDYTYSKKDNCITMNLENGIGEIEEVSFYVQDLVLDRYTPEQVAEIIKRASSGFYGGCKYSASAKFAKSHGMVLYRGSRVYISHDMIAKNGYGVEGTVNISMDYDPNTNSLIYF